MQTKKTPTETIKSDQGRPFTEEEIISIRQLLESSERLKWLRTAISGWAAWISVVVAAITLFGEAIKKILKAAVT